VNPKIDKVLDDLRGAWRFRWLAFGSAAALALAGWLIVFTLPDRYGARASVLVDTRTALKPALVGVALEQDVGVELSYVRGALLTDSSLLKTAYAAGVLPTYVVDPFHQDQAVSNLRKHVLLTMQSADDRPEMGPGGMIYRISYQDTRRERALSIVSILLQRFVDETLGGKKQGSQSAQQFLDAQVKEYEKRLRASEDRLAEFKSRNFGLMPSERGSYFTQLQKESENVEDTRTKLLVAESRRAALEKQLHGDAAIMATAAVPAAGRSDKTEGLDTVSQIAQTRARLDELLLRFTDNHPDVIDARKNLAELEARRAAEIESLRSGNPAAAAASGASANPVYQSIVLELNKADVDIADLRTQLGEHEDKAKALRKLLDTAPAAEAEYAQLTRDYDVNKAQYTALLSSYEKARLGEQADTAGSVKFQVVEPPLVSSVPIWPPRGTWLAEILLVAMAAGGALAYGLDRLWPMVGSASGLAGFTGVTVLAEIGSAFPKQTGRRRRREIWHAVLAAACLVAAFGVALALTHRGVRLTVPTLQRLV
jgi:polysaccharide chain length determinant protein (PEP-CTERM system associated)